MTTKLMIPRRPVPVLVLSLTLACIERATPAAEPTTFTPAVPVETPVADAPIERAPVGGAVTAEIGFRQGEQCSIGAIGLEFPLVAADGSEVVLMGHYDTYYEDGTDVLLQGFWHIEPGRSGMFGTYMPDEAITLIDWLGVDVSTCDAAERLAASAVAEANAYLARKRWLTLAEFEDFDHHGGPGPGPEDHYDCVTGTKLDLCASVAGFTGVLRDPEWKQYSFTSLYVNLRACVALAVQDEQTEGPSERTAIEVFDITGIVAALPSEYGVECGTPRDS